MTSKLSKAFANIAAIALLAPLISACTSVKLGESTAGNINIATFNIRMAPEGKATHDKDNHWNDRKNSLAKLVDFYEFEIFGTQEGFKYQLDFIKGELKNFDYIGAGRDDGAKSGEYCAIFYNAEKFECLENSTFWYSETPESPSFGWGVSHRRICTWGKFKMKSNGKIFFVFNSHWDHKVELARQNSAKMMIEKIKSIAGNSPVFAMGDLNATDNKDSIKELYKHPMVLKDSFLSADAKRLGPTGTFHGFKGKGSNRIDYIFTSPNVKILKYGVLTNSENLKFPSDHFPVMITVKLP